MPFELSEIRMRRGCQAVDPRDQHEKERLKAGDDLKIVLDGHMVMLITPGCEIAVPFSSVAGATFKRIATEVAVPAANPVKPKGKGDRNV